jgi:hypothetical protein
MLASVKAAHDSRQPGCNTVLGIHPYRSVAFDASFSVIPHPRVMKRDTPENDSATYANHQPLRVACHRRELCKNSTHYVLCRRISLIESVLSIPRLAVHGTQMNLLAIVASTSAVALRVRRGGGGYKLVHNGWNYPLRSPIVALTFSEYRTAVSLHFFGRAWVFCYASECGVKESRKLTALVGMRGGL